MKFAMIGLGKMGLNLVKNAVDNGHEVVAFDLNADFVKEAADYSDKVSAASDLDDMLAQLPSPKVVWVMVPAGVPTNSTIDTLIEKMVEGRVEKFYKEVCLLEQPFVKNPDVTIEQMITEKVAKIGEKISVRRFVRYKLGEGLEKRVDDLAAEVAAQTAAMQK